MTVLLVTTIAIIISLSGIALLASQNAKRRRAGGLGAHTPKRVTVMLGYCLLLAPIALLTALGQTTPFILWFAALSVAGWLLALRQPAHRLK